FTKHCTLRRTGLQDLRARRTETIDAISGKIRQTLASPVLAWTAGVVRRLRVRAIPAFKGKKGRGAPHVDRRGVLHRAGQSPLFPPQPLLLTSLAFPRASGLKSKAISQPAYFLPDGGFHGNQSRQAQRISWESAGRFWRNVQRRADSHGRQARLVQRPGGGRSANPGGTGKTHGDSRALHSRVVERAGGGRLRDVRCRNRKISPQRRTGLRDGGRQQPSVHARSVSGGACCDQGGRSTYRAIQDG